MLPRATRQDRTGQGLLTSPEACGVLREHLPLSMSVRLECSVQGFWRLDVRAAQPMAIKQSHSGSLALNLPARPTVFAS